MGKNAGEQGFVGSVQGRGSREIIIIGLAAAGACWYGSGIGGPDVGLDNVFIWYKRDLKALGEWCAGRGKGKNQCMVETEQALVWHSLRYKRPCQIDIFSHAGG